MGAARNTPRRPPTRSTALLVLVALLLAGCTAPPSGEEGATDAPTAETRRSVECPPPDDRLYKAGVVGPPQWEPGDSWRYDILNVTGERRGYVQYDVLACDLIRGETAYRVREERLRLRDYPHNMTEEPRILELHYDTDTLNQVWDVCGTDYHGFGDCAGRTREWDFPLSANKTWTDHCCGDVIQQRHFLAKPVDGGRWNLTMSAGQPQDVALVWVYDVSTGLFVERVERPRERGLEDESQDRWVLVEPASSAGWGGSDPQGAKASAGPVAR